MSKNPLERQVELQRAVPTRVRTPQVPNEHSTTPSRRGKRGLTIYFDPDTHLTLKELSLHHGKPVNTLLIEGVNLMLREYGRKPIA